MIVRQGDLKKKNEYMIKQTRFFVLSRDGQIKYYKDKTLHRGTVLLCRETRVTKTSRTSFEIVAPSRTWFLYEVETNTIDAWIRDIEAIVADL